MSPMVWIIEREAFPDLHVAFAAAIGRSGQSCVLWRDEWWETGEFPNFGNAPALFHGSLGNAHRIARELPWQPGAYCATERFHSSAWYEPARPWLLHRHWRFTTVEKLVNDPHGVAGPLAVEGQVFVRPDSPLKPFSGRVCSLTDMSLRSLDFGFYYDDPATPIVVAPVRAIAREWRFVVVDGEVIAGSGYEARDRSARDAAGLPTRDAQAVASALNAPERVFVLDLCEVDGDVRLLELNPFSGADLYGCDLDAIVRTVGRAVSSPTD